MNPPAAFWLEYVPVLKTPDAKEIMRCYNDIAGIGLDHLNAETRDFIRAVRIICGCGDHRNGKPHTVRQGLVIYSTRREANREACRLNREHAFWQKGKPPLWVVRVRIARFAP